MSLPDWIDPLLDAEEMRAVDEWAIDEQAVPSLELMEAAGSALAERAIELAPAGPVRLVCGKGNNGGDGLVAARRLAESGLEVEVLLAWPADELSDDAAANLERLDEGAVSEIAEDEWAARLEGSGAIVEAIFGTGFSGAPRAPADAAIEAINAAGAPVVACDIASGVDGSTGECEGVAVEANHTVSFHAAKRGHLIHPGKGRTGELRVADIGIPEGVPVEASGGVISERVLGRVPSRGASSSKFSSGDVVLVGGSRGMTGAITMAAQAAIRAGAGYAAVAVPRCVEPVIEAKLTEVMSLGLDDDGERLVPAAADAILERASSAAFAVLGPGLGRSQEVERLVAELLGGIEVPLLIDADGLHALGGSLHTIAAREAPTVLTPHEGELGRLLERERTELAEHRLEAATDCARCAGAVVVLKGDDTIVTDGELVAVNSLAAPALATAGTGDVLSGVIGALGARGMEPFEAACAGVLAHARAGRDAAERIGTDSVIATDVIDSIPAGLAG